MKATPLQFVAWFWLAMIFGPVLAFGILDRTQRVRPSEGES